MTAHTTTADAELLLAYARHRSADAFAELVRRYATFVYHVGLRITRNREDAADVAQECFLQLAAQAGRIVQPLPAWLHTLARSRAIDLIRRRSARQRHEQQAPPPQESALSLEQWEALRSQVDEAIEKLPEEDRCCIVGIYLEGRTQQQLADDLGISQGTVSRRIERGIDRLRDYLREAGVDLSTASLGVALAQLGADIPANLTANLAKIGLSGVGASTTAVANGLARLAAGIALAAAVIGVSYWAFRGSAQVSTSTTQPTSANQGQARQASDRVIIKGIQPGQRDTSPYAQGLSILLQHLGHKDATYTRVMGYSGVAFALQMDLSGPMRDGKYDVAWWPNDCYAFDLRIDFLAQAFGRELRKINSDPAAYKTDAQREYQARFEPAIIQAIDQGYPVLAQQVAAYLITGYDRPNHRAIGIWPSPGQPAFGPSKDPVWGILVPGKPLTPLSRDEAEIHSLRWAIALWDETAAAISAGTDPSKLLTGSKAYAKWLEFLQQQADGVGPGRDAWDNNLMIHLRYNRAAAAAYLREVAANQPAIAEHVLAAADLYQQVFDEAAPAPFWGQFDANPEVRPQKLKEYTDIVRRASQLEAQAIDEIRLVVPPSGGLE